jgi:hypothetical protein
MGEDYCMPEKKGRKGAEEQRSRGATLGAACGYGPRAAEVPFVTLFELDTLGREELAGKQCDGWLLSKIYN